MSGESPFPSFQMMTSLCFFTRWKEQQILLGSFTRIPFSSNPGGNHLSTFPPPNMSIQKFRLRHHEGTLLEAMHSELASPFGERVHVFQVLQGNIQVELKFSFLTQKSFSTCTERIIKSLPAPHSYCGMGEGEIRHASIILFFLSF